MSGISLFIVCIFSFFVCLPQANWQGYGNMSSYNLTEIWNFIENNVGFAFTNSTINQFNTDFSNHLNSLWNPAWNIFTITSPPSIDTVLYGYAFRSHWMWYNGYSYKGNLLTFIIWKDYNCHNWITDRASSDYGPTQQSQVNTVISSLTYIGDVWRTAKQLVDGLANQAGFSGDKAYSIVMSQDNSNTTIAGTFCAVNNQFLTGVIKQDFLNGEYWGKYLFFRTR